MATNPNRPVKFSKRLLVMNEGINNKFDALKIKDTQFSDIQEFIYDDVGDLTLRSGSKVLTVNIGDTPVKYLNIFRREY